VSVCLRRRALELAPTDAAIRTELRKLKGDRVDRVETAKEMYGGLFGDRPAAPPPATWGQTVSKTVGAVVGGLGSMLWRGRRQPPAAS
jgi:hypothetical protein